MLVAQLTGEVAETTAALPAKLMRHNNWSHLSALDNSLILKYIRNHFFGCSDSLLWELSKLEGSVQSEQNFHACGFDDVKDLQC